MTYPVFFQAMSVEELAVDFTVSAERLNAARVHLHGDGNRLAFAVLACCHRYLGYPPRNAANLPGSIVAFVAQQLGVPASLFAECNWGGLNRRRHLDKCRKLRG